MEQTERTRPDKETQTSVEELYLVHHCHTDIGYTHDQPVLWDLQRRFIDRAIELAEKDLDVTDRSAFRWTIETTGPLLHWLETASEDQIERLQRLEDKGRIEVTAMLANIVPLYGPEQLIESLRPVKYMRDEYGFDIRYAMNFDVTGQSWPLVDILLDAGIEGFWMGINNHFGASPFDRPHLFHWEGPSGRKLPTLDGYHYSAGLNLGIGRDISMFRKHWKEIERRLETVGYDLPTLAIPTYHPFGDNGPPFDSYGPFVREWNQQSAVQNGDLPYIRIATPADWWRSIQDSVENAPTHRGDWSDFWNFGCLSSAREVAINRENRRRLVNADAIEAVLGPLENGWHDRPLTRRTSDETRAQAWWNQLFFDEHTWGADTAVSTPESDDTRSQWIHKAVYAYEARSLSHLQQRDAIAELSRLVTNGGDHK